MGRKKYYVNMQSREISQIKYGNNADFTIYATEGEVQTLRQKLNQMYDAELGTFIRSHVPFIPYHHDQSNDDYDQGITEAFQMIYDLGNEEAKRHIKEMGVLDQHHM